ncbi:GGDEF domain-containing protein [Colwellia demingiae]|uniref:diguanylate cyclase n=1 Tax=Colwellia demingiae TaxID=89401 RepID=A0A5C6QRJ5_9GAMM|nr:sensor domain-containing diguanylate cyclase [Colwellia demingiae]TWX71886.1 GGDEF domain-containing protein [Colwellia demingiae]
MKSKTKSSSELDANEFEEVLTLFFNALPDPIFVIDQTGFVIKQLGGNANEIYPFLYPFKDKLEGNNLSTLLPSHLFSTFMDTINKTINDDSLTCVDFEIANEGNILGIKNQWYQGRVFPLKQRRDDVRVVLWIAINITEQKLLELELKNLAEKDGLTGSYNRRYFTEVIQRSFLLYLRDKLPFCILMLDIDFFKAVNDNFGHDGGDKLLIALTDVFKDSIRDIDLLARYGGEEFIVLLPNTTTQKAMVVAERIRVATQQCNILHDEKSITVTVSIGVSEITVNDTSFENVTKRADIALYTAKTSGRNKVCIE